MTTICDDCCRIKCRALTIISIILQYCYRFDYACYCLFSADFYFFTWKAPMFSFLSFVYICSLSLSFLLSAYSRPSTENGIIGNFLKVWGGCEFLLGSNSPYLFVCDAIANFWIQSFCVFHFIFVISNRFYFAFLNIFLVLFAFGFNEFLLPLFSWWFRVKQKITDKKEIYCLLFHPIQCSRILVIGQFLRFIF